MTVCCRSEESGGSLEAASASEVDGSTSPKQKKKGSVGFWNKDKSARKSQKSIFNKVKKIFVKNKTWMVIRHILDLGCFAY